MKKLLSLLGAIGLVATSSATVVSCDNGDKDSSTTDFKADFSTFTDLNSITDAIAKNAGIEFNKTTSVSFYKNIDEVNTIEDGVINKKDPTDDMPVAIEDIETIKGMESVSYLAMDVTIDTENPEASTASTVLKGTITNEKAAPVEKTDLSTITTKELGEIAAADAKTIVEAINAKNDGLNLTEADVDVTPKDDNTGATVKAKDDSANFTGSVDVTFTVKAAPVEKTDLSAITTKELGEIATADAKTIVEAINAKNDGLNLTEADVEVTPKGDNTGATVTAKKESANFTGTVEVTFTVTQG
jgi:hypothetical protein